MMLFGIAHRLGEALKAKGVPFDVVYGPERADTVTPGTRPRIVIERDRDAGDGLGPARSVHTNPNMRGVRAIGCLVRVFAKSEKAAAAVHDHEGVADVVVDAVLVALDRIIRGDETLWAISSAKLLSTADLELRGLTTWPGVVYELKFAIDRGIFDRDYAGAAAVEVEVGTDVKVKSTTVVKIAGAGSETACGGS